MKRIALVAIILTGLLASSGCNRTFKGEQTHDLEPDKLASVTPDVAAKHMIIEFSTEGNVPVSAALIKHEDENLAFTALEEGKPPEQAMKAAKPMAEQVNIASGRFTTPRTNSPAKYSILFVTKKPTKVTVKTTSE